MNSKRNSLVKLTTPLALAGLLAISAGVHAQSVPVVKNGISEPVKNWSRAVEAGDTAAIERMNSPETIAYIPNAMIVKGAKNIAQGYDGMFKAYNAKVQIKDAQYIESKNLIHSWGLYILTITPKAGGAPVVMEGRFSDIATKVNGQWRYIMDHASLPVKN